MHLDLSEFIINVGYIGIFLIIFAESGLLIGFFLPGDTLLFSAGLLASQNILSLPILLVICFVAAVLGDNVGYAFGHSIGRKLFEREDSWFFHRKNLIAAENYYQKHGAKTIVLARFIPIIRTFAPIIAGIAKMNYPKFIRYNLIGALLWAIGLTVAGYFLGKLIPDLDKYLLPIIAVIFIASILPGIWHLKR